MLEGKRNTNRGAYFMYNLQEDMCEQLKEEKGDITIFLKYPKTDVIVYFFVLISFFIWGF